MLSKCCCCVPLRTGSLVIAVLGILGALVFLALSKGEWLSIVDGIFFLLPYAFLLFGAIKYNDKAVLVCVVLTALSIMIIDASIILEIVFGIIAIVDPELADCKALNEVLFFYDCDELRFSTIVKEAVKLIGLIGLSLINIYFWICNYSFYEELKEGGSEAAV